MRYIQRTVSISSAGPGTSTTRSVCRLLCSPRLSSLFALPDGVGETHARYRCDQRGKPHQHSLSHCAGKLSACDAKPGHAGPLTQYRRSPCSLGPATSALSFICGAGQGAIRIPRLLMSAERNPLPDRIIIAYLWQEQHGIEWESQRAGQADPEQLHRIAARTAFPCSMN